MMGPVRPSSRLWLLLLVLTSMLGQFSVNMIRPATTYKVDALGGDAAVVGLVAASYAIVPLVIAMPVGRLIQRMGTVAGLIGGGLCVMAAGAAAIAFSSAVWGVVLGSAALGLGQLVFAIGGQSGVTRAADPAKRDAAFGWFTAAVSAGQMLGPPVAGWIISAPEDVGTGIDLSILAGGAAALPGALLLFLALWRMRRHAHGAPATGVAASARDGEPKASTRAILRTPRVGSHIAASAGLLALTDVLVAFLPLLGQQAGLSPSEVGLLLALRGLGSLASRVLLGGLVRRISREVLLVLSLLLSAISFAAMPFTTGTVAMAGALMAVGGFFLGLGQPLTMTMVTAAVPEGWSAPALALRLIGNRLGQVAMPAAAGALAGPVGPAAAVWLGAAVLLVSGADQLRHLRRHS